MSDDIFGVEYDVNEPEKMYVENPLTGEEVWEYSLDDDDKQVFVQKSYVEMLGPDSDVQRALDMQQSNSKIKGSIKAQRKGIGVENAFSAEKTYDEETDELTKVITDWHLVAFAGPNIGKKIPLECTPENIRKIMTNPKYSWLREDCLNFKAASKNFMKTGGKNLETT